MVIAAELSTGMAIRLEGQVYRVLEVEAKAGAAKMGGLVRAKLVNARSGRMWEHSFRPQQRLEDVELERRKLEFLYSDGNSCTFLRLDNYEQIEAPLTALGPAEKFIQPGTEIPAEFFEGELINLDVPDFVESAVATTAPPTRSQQDSSRKEAVLENGLRVQVPLFIAPGEMVRVDLKSGRYLERVRVEHKKGA